MLCSSASLSKVVLIVSRAEAPPFSFRTLLMSSVAPAKEEILSCAELAGRETAAEDMFSVLLPYTCKVE